MGKLTSHLKHSTFQHAFNSRYWLGKSWRQQSPNPSCNSPSANRVPRRGVRPRYLDIHRRQLLLTSQCHGQRVQHLLPNRKSSRNRLSPLPLQLCQHRRWCPVIKTTLIHAGLNDLVIFGAVYNMLSRWGNEAYMPTGRNTLVSFLMLGGVGYAAFLGGGLVYTHGVGVQRMGKGKEEKDAEVAKEKVEAKKEL